MSGLFRGLNKNVVVLSITSLFTDISSEMLYPIIPIFLTSSLGAPMSVVGLIEGLAEATASILKVFSGWFSDLFGKRQPFVALGYFLSAVGKLTLPLARSWPVVLVARFIDRFGKGVRTSPRDAMLADSTDAIYHGKVFGFHRAMDTLGACFGPLLTIWLLAILNGNLRAIFIVAFVPAILSVAILVLFLKEKPVRRPAAAMPARISLNLKNFSPLFKRFILISSVFAAGNSSDAFLIMRSKDVGLSVTMVIVAYIVYNVSYSALSLPFGSLSDKIGRKWIITGGYAVFSLVYLGFGLYANHATIWPLFFIYGFYMAMTDGIGKAFITDTVDEGSRATAIGLYYCISGILMLLASVVAGLLWTHVCVSAPFVYGSALAAIATVLCVFLL